MPSRAILIWFLPVQEAPEKIPNIVTVFEIGSIVQLEGYESEPAVTMQVAVDITVN